jgi:hypothetical protein
MHPQEHVLREVLGARSILNGPRNQGEHEILVSINQFLECVLITGAATFDELALVHILHPPPY